MGCPHMAVYRCYFINGENHITEAPTIIEASHDEAAIEEAQRMRDSRPQCASVEIWCGTQRVGSVKLPLIR